MWSSPTISHDRRFWSLGFPEFSAFELQPMSGITYLDTYFLELSGASEESLHCHELVHVVQWQVLGPRDFLLLYAAGLVEQGYLGSPLEKMAYKQCLEGSGANRP
jgi:hypothetical protein